MTETGVGGQRLVLSHSDQFWRPCDPSGRSKDRRRRESVPGRCSPETSCLRGGLGCRAVILASAPTTVLEVAGVRPSQRGLVQQPSRDRRAHHGQVGATRAIVLRVL